MQSKGSSNTPESSRWRLTLIVGAVALLFGIVVSVGAFLFLESQRRHREEAYESAYRAAIVPNDMLRAADAKRGELIANGCLACHSTGKGEKNKIGPNLFGLVGRGIASVDDFTYSDALVKHKGRIWTTDELYEWFRDPSEFAPGTKMTFGGLGDPQDRMDLIAYLITLH